MRMVRIQGDNSAIFIFVSFVLEKGISFQSRFFLSRVDFLFTGFITPDKKDNRDNLGLHVISHISSLKHIL